MVAHFEFNWVSKKKIKIWFMVLFTHSAWAVEYTDCISAEGWDFPNEYPGYDNKQSDFEVPVMLELRGMRITPSLPSLPGPLWAEVVVPDRVLSMG